MKRTRVLRTTAAPTPSAELSHDEDAPSTHPPSDRVAPTRAEGSQNKPRTERSTGNTTLIPIIDADGTELSRVSVAEAHVGDG